MAAVTDGDEAAFRQAARPAMATGVLVSAMLIRPDGTRTAVIGRPALDAGMSESVRQRLDAAAAKNGLLWVGTFGSGLRQRAGFAYALASSPETGIVYAELQLAAIPLLLPVQMLRFDEDGVNDLQVALYTDASERPESLLFSLARRLPLDGMRATLPITVGEDTWTLVIAPYEPLTGGLSRAAPWVLLAAGVVLAVLRAGIVEVSGRRAARRCGRGRSGSGSSCRSRPTSSPSSIRTG